MPDTINVKQKFRLYYNNGTRNVVELKTFESDGELSAEEWAKDYISQFEQFGNTFVEEA